MDLGLRDRVAVVTAASKGLGRASAEALSEEGVKLVLNARSSAALESLASSLPEAVAVGGDITEAAVPGLLVEAAVRRWGRVDIVVGNAPGPPPGGALDVEDDQVLAAVNANALASIRLARAALPYMRSQSWGRICFIASSSVRQPIPALSLSNMARTGLWAWAKTAAQEVAADGVTINLACPGFHATERLKDLNVEGRLGDPADFGRVVAFLCSEPAKFVSGIAMGVDGATVSGLL